VSIGILDGLSIVEGSAFVAAPLGGMTLAQLGADVIRYDQIGGGPDYLRWPVTENNCSLFWSGMNKGKRSIQIDLRSEEGQEIISNIISRPGRDAGIFLTNFPTRGELSFESLIKRRADLIMVSLTGNFDGSSEVDYTVNASMGFPEITGPAGSQVPVNSVLPAWDIAMGNLAAVAILAAERRRQRTGKGALVKLALSDVALASVAGLGRLGQAELGQKAVKDGNYLYGAFGHDFITRDQKRLMVVALTGRQWNALKTATDLDVVSISSTTGADLNTESGRFAARSEIRSTLASWFASESLESIRCTFRKYGVLWGLYQDFHELVKADSRASINNPMFNYVEHPSIGTRIQLAIATLPTV